MFFAAHAFLFDIAFFAAFYFAKSAFFDYAMPLLTRALSRASALDVALFRHLFIFADAASARRHYSFERHAHMPMPRAVMVFAADCHAAAELMLPRDGDVTPFC